MKATVFYSWQSDLANATNRSLIEDALRKAAKEISNDESINIEPVIDRDTQGVAGAPDIAATIFGKITAADIFVADISLVIKGKKRSTPNPNVLIELGYALKALGHERVVFVFNEASGKKEKLPFDLKTRRILTYHADATSDLAKVREELVKDFKAALLSGFSHAAPPASNSAILDSIKNKTPSRKIDLRAHLAEVLADLERIEPKMMRDGGTAQDLLDALPKTEGIILSFAKLADIVALMDDEESATEIFQWFGKVLAKCDPVKKEMQGQTWNADGDFYKFVGHELFVVFIAPFLREEKWDLLGKILKGTLRVGPTLSYPQESKQKWAELSAYSPLLADEGKKNQRMSLRADLLQSRHESGALASVSPFKEFVEADFFLYLHGDNERQGEYHSEWYPQSALWLKHVPRFVEEAEDYPTAMKICHSLEIRDTDELKRRLESSKRLQYARHSPFYGNEIQKIGSKGGAVIVHTDTTNLDPYE